MLQIVSQGYSDDRLFISLCLCMFIWLLLAAHLFGRGSACACCVFCTATAPSSLLLTTKHNCFLCVIAHTRVQVKQFLS